MSADPTTVHPAQVHGLEVRYGRTHALAGVSLAVAAGSVHALLGRNGAGKSSLVRCLLGQQKPEAGRVTLFGHDAWRERVAAMRRIGVVPEEPDAPPTMSAEELGRFLARIYPRWDAAGYAARLARFGVPPGTPFGRLSKGQKGQVMLGLALAHSPDLLVLDDPTLGLDVVARNSVFEELIGDLADRGTTVFLTSHDLAGVERICSRVGILRAGKLLVDDDLEALKARIRLLRYRRIGAAGDELGGFEVIRREEGPLGIAAVVANFSDERFARLAATPGVVDPKPSALSLEEIFTALTAEKGARA